MVGDENLPRPGSIIVARDGRPEQAQATRWAKPNDAAEIEVAPRQANGVARVDVVLELDVVVVRSGSRAPGNALNVGIKRVRCSRRPVGAEWRHVSGELEDVRVSQKLIVDEPSAVAVAKRAAVAPIGGEINPLATEVRVPNGQGIYL